MTRVSLKWLAILAGAVCLALALAPSNESPDESSLLDAGPPRLLQSAASGRAGPPTRGLAATPPLATPTPPLPGEGPVTYPLDLSSVQAAMPDNLYWSLGAPTRDERVLEARAAHERRHNEALGRLQAGEAGEEEIHAYFEAQRRLHQDYLELCTRVLEDHGDELPEQDRGLYELGARMHRDRLAELPRRHAEAIERRRAQDRRRAEWEAGGKQTP